MNNLLAAIVDKFANSAIYNDVGGRIYLDEAPQGTEFPYVVFRIVAATPENTFKEDIEDVLIQISLFSISAGATEITTMYSDLQTLLDRKTLTITGGVCVNLLRQGLVTMIDDITTPAGTASCKHWAADYSVMYQTA